MRKQSGFTLIEMMAALTLLALLLSVALPFSGLVKRRAQEQELRHSLQLIRHAIDAYYQASIEGRIDKSLDRSGYPPDLDSLVKGAQDKTNPNGGKLYFLRRLPADPMCERCEGRAAADTWDTRSYDSSADSFSSGRDVFDVRSKSLREGINGTRYKEW
ncbi:type II secretion system protein [Achromobacter seleniivolatilans]|uniref:Type II secretion system protein n=1 Tax=Achromobacter seleniivolatilans TaxID=3047478 RepID=A0ABY9LUR9_9BURK|nr:type II secretion system protein [Achromobacter sp. R39]WMD18297.1 type II secretion system protein [Achromobacter sp. R39]